MLNSSTRCNQGHHEVRAGIQRAWQRAGQLTDSDGAGAARHDDDAQRRQQRHTRQQRQAARELPTQHQHL
jgi:hypothetical protein